MPERSTVDLIHEQLDRGAPTETEFRCTRVRDRDVFVGVDRDLNLIALFPPSQIGRDVAIGDVQFRSNAQVDWEGSESSEVFSTLRLARSDIADVRTFALVIDSIVASTKADDGGEAYASLLEAWLAVLQARRDPTHAELLGFWGELFVIAESRNKTSTSSAWQWEDKAPCDFAVGSQFFEVKTCLGPGRIHHTSLGQSGFCIQNSAVLLSIRCEETDLGDSVEDLYREIVSSPGFSEVESAKLVSAMARRVGFGHLIREIQFDREAARRSRRAYPWESIPIPSFPRGVVDASWRFELDDSSGEGHAQFVDRVLGNSDYL